MSSAADHKGREATTRIPVYVENQKFRRKNNTEDVLTVLRQTMKIRGKEGRITCTNESVGRKCVKKIRGSARNSKFRRKSEYRSDGLCLTPLRQTLKSKGEGGRTPGAADHKRRKFH